MERDVQKRLIYVKETNTIRSIATAGVNSVIGVIFENLGAREKEGTHSFLTDFVGLFHVCWSLLYVSF